MNVRRFLEGLWASELEGLAEAEAEARGRELLAIFLLKNEKKIAGKTKKGDDAAIREALYHMWALRLGGEIGDKVRDIQERKIRLACEPLIDAQTPKVQLVRIVAAAVVELVF